jgi:myo-inositol 2-dehydrogenase/D-chiro-inositol 1-dehydrogenase
VVGFAVLGCGRIGRIHARNIRAHAGAELVACYDLVEAAAAGIAAELGARHARSVDEVLANPQVQAVLIASSTDTHVDLLARAVLAGKAVLCEKPIDLDTARVAACWRDIAGLNPVVMVGFNRRFDPPAGAGGDHQPGPSATAAELCRRVRRAIPRHDNPRFRHGPLPRR